MTPGDRVATLEKKLRSTDESGSKSKRVVQGDIFWDVLRRVSPGGVRRTRRDGGVERWQGGAEEKVDEGKRKAVVLTVISTRRKKNRQGARRLLKNNSGKGGKEREENEKNVGGGRAGEKKRGEGQGEQLGNLKKTRRGKEEKKNERRENKEPGEHSQRKLRLNK